MRVGTGALASLPDKLDELLKEEYKLKPSVKREVESLSKDLRSMHAAVCKVTEVRWDYVDEKRRIWANNARKLSYDMEKNVDNILLRMGGNDFTKKMPNLGMKGKTSYQIADAIKNIKYRLQQLGDQVEDVAANTIDPVCEDQTDIIGMEEATDKLIKLACDGDQQLKILPIVGLGGLGKTSLATAVYDRIKMQFDCRVFIPVGQSPAIKKIFKTMLYQLDKYKYMTIPEASWDKGQLIYELRKFLRNKRYLIVIDDLRDRIFWDIISSSLPSNNYGSRVITTTRVNNIAESCSSHKDLIYEIKPLGYQNSKRLFRKRCFGSEDNCHHALTEVDEILKMCGGMPLGIISIASEIASLLNRKVKEPFQEMMKLLHSARMGEYGRANSPSMEELTNILSYSYFDLPRTLRACLLYLAASAKNQRIQKDNLVKKWIAEGLIPEDEDCSREKVASRYLDDLVNRNVIQPVQYGNCNYEINFMMLYALRVMAREENFATILSGFHTSEAYVDVMPIRLFIQCSDSERSISTERMNLNKVHSLTMLGPAKLVLFKNLEHVQVLDLDGCEDLNNSAMHDICQIIQLKYLSLMKTQVTEIPSQIANLQYLEILAIRNTPITTLPPQIGKLLNLETLDVRQTRVNELPKEVTKLPKLAHLHFGQSGSLGVKLPVGCGQLKSVKVMGTVDSKECSGSAMEEISEMAEVRELAVVLYDGPTDNKRNYKLLSSIGKCKKLQSLTICGDSDPSDKLPPASADASSNFPSLNKLKVAGRFVKVPVWIEQLCVLNKLDIRVCKLEPDDLGKLGGLPRLSSLALALVAGLPRRRVVITSSAGFRTLEDFNFDCHVPWVTFQAGAMPMLKHLDLMLYSCPADKSPSGIIRLQSLEKVILRYSSQYAGSDGVTETVAVMREEADSHANLIVLSINGNKEIFPSSTSVDSRVTGAEIEEC